MTELRDLYDENKNKTGEVIEKGEIVPKNRYYLTVVIWIENDKNEFLIQKRSQKKLGLWATTGGHPKSGESSIKGICTEVKEELGLDIDRNKLTLFKTIKTNDDFVDLYYLHSNINIDDIVLQTDEVESVKWASVKEINNLIENNLFLPSHAEFFKYCLEYKKGENIMKKMNIIVIFDKNLDKVLMCKRTKEPYKGMYNLVGGKIEKEKDGLNEAYRELREETNIQKEDVKLKYFMNIEYVSWNKDLEVYYGVLNKDVTLIEEVNKLEWVDINDNFFNMNKYAGEGNIGHIIEEIKLDLKK